MGRTHSFQPGMGWSRTRAGYHIRELPATVGPHRTPPLEDVLLQHETFTDGLFDTLHIFCGRWPDGRRWCYQLTDVSSFTTHELRDLASYARTLDELDRVIACEVRAREEALLPY